MAKVYYPTAQARLQLRLDEGPNIGALKAALERKPGDGSFGVTTPTTHEGIKQALATNFRNQLLLEQSRSILSPNEYLRQKTQLDKQKKLLQYAKQGSQSKNTELPELMRSEGDDELNVLFSALPISCSVERNGIRDADTAEVTFDYRDLPIDPRSIRAGFVSLVIGSVSSEEYKRGVSSREVRESDGMLVSIVERRSDEELRFSGSASRFSGFIDEWHIELGEDGDTVTLTMRDVTGIYLDQPMQTGLTIDLSKPLDVGISDFINQFPSLRGAVVFFGTPEQLEDQPSNPNPVKAPIPEKSIPKVAKSKKGKKSKAQKQGDQDDNVWDHIVTVCAKLGFVPFVRGFILYIVEPRNLFDQASKSRKMVFGRNIKTLEFARKMSGITTQTIEVRSPDPDIGRTRWARYPVLNNEPSCGILGDPNSPQPVVSRPQKVSPLGKPDEQVLVMNIARVSDLEALKRIAENAFQEIARQEIEGSFETDDLDSFKESGDSTDMLFPEQDLLDLNPGDTVTMLYAAPNTSAQGDPYQETEKEGKRSSASGQELASMTFARRRDYLTGLGMSPSVAHRLAAVAEGIPMANSFRVGTVNIDFDVDDGISVGCSFYNFITVRELGHADNAGIATPQPAQDISNVAGRV